MRHILDSLIVRTVGIIILIEIMVLGILGYRNTRYFSQRIEDRFVQQIQVPGRLMLEAALRYRSVNDAQIMKQFVGEGITEALLVGADGKVYYSLNPEYRDKDIRDVPEIGYRESPAGDSAAVYIDHFKEDGNSFIVCMTPILSESNQYLGTLFIKAGTRQLDEEKQGVIHMFLFGSVLAVLFTAGIGFLFSLRTQKRFSRLIAVFHNISEGEGDLTQRLEAESHDEMGEIALNYNLFADKLREIISKVQTLVENLATAFKEVSVSSNEVTINVHNQSEQMKDILGMIQDLSAYLKEASRNSGQMIGQAQQNSQHAESGKQINAGLKETMSMICEGEQQFKDELVQLQDNSIEIGTLVKVISDIAEQVNILALNASIEAVKAGDYGRGFSVVAEEIRELAEHTQKSAQQITPKIDTIRSQVNDAVSLMDNNLKRVNQMTDDVDRALDMNEMIDMTSTKTLELVEQTGKIFQQSNAAFEGMTERVSQINASSQENSIALNQVKDTIQDLTDGVEELRGLVQKFIVHKKERNGNEVFK